MAYPKQHTQADISDIYLLATATKGVFVNPALQVTTKNLILFLSKNITANCIPYVDHFITSSLLIIVVGNLLI